ncbi:MAG: glutamate-5-semialdehyde dehydrogenase [Deltaproteobacteria bacterium]|nr:glutamate-5-semialdehyde dehydrogenase [Deltaproteobacteria bacterium]
MKSLKKHIETICKRAHEAAPLVAKLSTEVKNQVLGRLAEILLSRREEIKRENEKDLKKARGKLSPAMLDRLTLTDKRIEEMARGVREVQALSDPVGQVVKSWTRPNGLQVSKVRIPLGVIGIIYESRPNVTIDAATLCLKSGNAVVLRGGSEAIHSNIFLGRLFRQAIQDSGLDPNILQVVDTPDRKAMEILVRQSRFVDLMIPRGGESLMKWMEEHSKIPVIKHDKGVCHVYVDEKADLKMAAEIAFNAKVQRPGVCNAMETLVVHEGIAGQFLPSMIRRFQTAGVEIRGDPATRRIVSGIKRATEKDWPAEYLDLILSVKVVSTMEEAIRHIQKYGSSHTETIVTEDATDAEEFLNRLDSSVVLWNASTRFNDGGQLGLGAEIGISTTKLHAFGPMGLEELTTTKFVVRGRGQIRE